MQWYLSQYSSASELVKPGTHLILTRTNVSVLGACLLPVALGRTCVSWDAMLQGTVLHQPLLACHSSERINNKYRDTTVLRFGILIKNIFSEHI